MIASKLLHKFWRYRGVESSDCTFLECSFDGYGALQESMDSCDIYYGNLIPDLFICHFQ